MPKANRKWFTIGEVANLMEMNRQTVSKLLRTKDLPHERYGKTAVRIYKTPFFEWCEQRGIELKEPTE